MLSELPSRLRTIAIVNDPSFDIVIVGHGAAGLTAALSAAEAAKSASTQISIAVLERAAEGQHGGNTRFTPCYMRLEAPDRLESGFVDSMIEVSDGRNDRAYFDRLATEAPATMAWLQGHDIPFHKPVYYLSAGPDRIQPVGGGETIVRELTRAAKAAGIEFIYDCTAKSLLCDSAGAIAGIVVHQQGREQTIATRAVVLACGGFQGNPDMLREHFGSGGETLTPISPGTRLNTGDGVRMGMSIGARAAGDWRGMHIEPVDPRAETPAPVVLVYPYGVVVDQTGKRFLDEGAGLVHETWEAFARKIHFETPGRIVYAVLDSRLRNIENFERAIRSEVPPFEADTLAELATLIDVPVSVLEKTVADYNAACTGNAATFDATITDGLAADSSLSPTKSNWARALDKPPFLAWPMIGAIAYTFGGLATDLDGRVLATDTDRPVQGLYAAGEITGHFHGTAPNAVAVLRAVVYGRITGQTVANSLS